MTAKELRAKTDVELKELLLELHREQFNLKMQKASGQLSKPHQFRRIRQDVARINMVLGEKGVVA